MRVSEWTRRFRRFIVAAKVSCQMSWLGPRKFCDDHNRSIVVRWTNLFCPFRSLFSGGKKEVLLAVSERSYYKVTFSDLYYLRHRLFVDPHFTNFYRASLTCNFLRFLEPRPRSFVVQSTSQLKTIGCRLRDN